MDSIPSQTLFVVGFFSLGYVLLIASKTARQQVDIYDLVMLSSIAIIPAIVVFFPNAALWLAKITGVKFPFVTMFGLLIGILFIFAHRLTIKLHKVEEDTRLLIQEISILRQSIDKQSSDRQDD